MGPGQLTPNPLEIAVLQRIADDNPGVAFDMPNLRVLNRTFTGVGSFTEFQTKSRLMTLVRRDVGPSVIITIPGQCGLGAVAFLEDEELKTLEFFVLVEEPHAHWDGNFDGFALQPIQSHTIHPRSS